MFTGPANHSPSPGKHWESEETSTLFVSSKFLRMETEVYRGWRSFPTRCKENHGGRKEGSRKYARGKKWDKTQLWPGYSFGAAGVSGSLFFFFLSTPSHPISSTVLFPLLALHFCPSVLISLSSSWDKWHLKLKQIGKISSLFIISSINTHYPNVAIINSFKTIGMRGNLWSSVGIHPVVMRVTKTFLSILAFIMGREVGN